MAAKAAADVVGGGLATTASYLLHEAHPTWGGAATAFGLGAVTAGVFMGFGFGVGKVLGKVKIALGFRGRLSAARPVMAGGSPTLAEVARPGVQREAVEAGGVAVLDSNPAVLERAQAISAPEISAPRPGTKPPNDPYRRPSGYRMGIRDTVWENSQGADGQVRDPLTGRVISKDEPWDMGHKPGHEFRKHQRSARQRQTSRAQFLDEYNNSDQYHPELPKSNRGHLAEDETDDFLGP